MFIKQTETQLLGSDPHLKHISFNEMEVVKINVLQ